LAPPAPLPPAVAAGAPAPPGAPCTAVLCRGATSGRPIRAAFYEIPAPPRLRGGVSHFHPAPADSAGLSARVVRRQIGAMAYGGIDAGIAAWRGPGTRSDRAVPTLLRAARGTSFRWTLEIRRVGGRTPH